jgi:hypothetical protein
MAKPEFYNRCISGVLEASGRDDLSENDLISLFERVQARIRRNERAGMNPREAAYEAGKELGTEMRLAAAIERRNRLKNVEVKRALVAQLRPGSEAADFRRALNKMDASVYAAQAEVLGPMVNELRAAGLHKVIARGDVQFDQRVIDELWAIEHGRASVTGDKMAFQAAQIIDRAQERARAMQNGAGAWIAKREHYVTRQSHDMDKIRGTKKGATPEETADLNFQAWRDFTMTKLDEATFDHLDDLTPTSIDKFMRATWNALASGVHETASGNELLRGFVGPANLAKRVSQERKLLFKDSASWGEYNRTFGRGTLWESVTRGLETGARNAAIMRGLGTNPEAMFDTVTAQVRKAAVDRGDVAASDALGTGFNKGVLNMLTGAANVPSNAGWAKFARVAMTVQTLAKLGGVVLSSLPDLANNAAVLRHNGVGLFESYANQVSSLFPKSKAGREAMATLGVGVDSMLGHIATRFSSAENLQGKSAKLVDIFHRANLLTFWTDSMKFGLGSMLSHNMGRLADTAFDALDPRLRTTLGTYGIKAADWDAARTHAGKDATGVARLLPVEIADEKVRTKFQNYMVDQIREAMNEPDAVSRTIITGGLAANTPWGMAVRVLTQFKTYPVTFINRTLGREFDFGVHGRGNGMDMAGITHLVVAMSLMGYLSMELKNLARGKNPRTMDAEDRASYAALVAAAMAQGGGLGLFGDFLFGERDRFGGGFLTNLIAGPTVGSLDQLGGVVQDLAKWAREGDPRAARDARSGAIGVVRNNAPFINMFYTRWAADYFIWYRLMEAANPGYLARYEDRVRREQHQTFWLRPSDAAR